MLSGGNDSENILLAAAIMHPSGHALPHLPSRHVGSEDTSHSFPPGADRTQVGPMLATWKGEGGKGGRGGAGGGEGGGGEGGGGGRGLG